MKSATLVRSPGGDQGTFGVLKTDDGLLEFHSLELPWIDRNGDGIGDPQVSCITAGVYECAWHESPSKGWCYSVTNVAGRSGILIHPANFGGNKELGWQSQLLGCIALGMSLGEMINVNGETQQVVLASRTAVDKFNAWGAREPFTLQIIEAG